MSEKANAARDVLRSEIRQYESKFGLDAELIISEGTLFLAVSGSGPRKAMVRLLASAAEIEDGTFREHVDARVNSVVVELYPAISILIRST